MLSRFAILVLLGSALQAQMPPDRLIEAAMRHAENFKQLAPGLIAEESLVQRCYRIPEHAWLTIGPAVDGLRAQMVRTEVSSAYTIGPLKNEPTGTFVELREMFAKNGKPTKTPAAAVKAMQTDTKLGYERVRRKMLAAFSDLGLLDVATDYGLILLAFTRPAMAKLTIKPSGPHFFGAEQAFVFLWVQSEGGLLEFGGSKAVRRPMHGEFWLRLSDGRPLRITASAEHAEPKHRLRDDATIEFVFSRAGCVVPVSVVHRHYVDSEFLTENLYTYSPFRLFRTDTTIRFIGPPK
jgi:hypothetical protein